MDDGSDIVKEESIAPQQTVKIPKIVMQTWKTDEVPDHWKASQRGIKRHMADWEYHLMTDEDNRAFVQMYFPDFLETYDEFEYGIMRADAIRYMWLYVNGGVYMDLDIMLIKPIDELFYEDKEVYLAPSGNYSSYYTNAFMASKPKVRMWLSCLAEMKKPYQFWQVGKHLKVMATTGPLMLTRVVNYKSRNKATYTKLPGELLITCTVCDEKPCDRNHGYARTLDGSSWVATDTKAMIFCSCHWKEIVIVVIIVLIALWIARKYYRESRRTQG